MTDYELKILNFISNNPFCRQRNIAAHLYTSITNQQFLDAMFKLYKENYINCYFFSDPANLEYYNQWFLTDKGNCVIMNTENKEGDKNYGETCVE